MRADFVWLQFDCPPHKSDRLVESFEFSHNLPQLGERRRIVGLERQHLAKGGLGIGEAAPAGKGGGVIEMRFGQIGHKLDGPRRAFERFLVQSLPAKR